MKTIIRDVLMVVVIAAVLIAGLQVTVQRIVVNGHSMNYTLHDGQQLLVNKIVYRFHEPERGDIIVLHPPPEVDKENFIKRIIGLPGEKVVIHDGRVFIHKEDGSVIELDEPYVTNQAIRSYQGEKIPEGEYFVMGDNRINSGDSRAGWTLPREDIVGKAWFSVWPSKYWGSVFNYDFHENEE